MGSSRRIPFAGSFVFGLHTLVMTQNPEQRLLFMNVPEINGQPNTGFLRNHKYFGPILCRDDFLVMSDLKGPRPILPKM
jgi:hypothetical protein